MKVNKLGMLAVVAAGSLFAATASASPASATFNLSEGSNAGPAGQVFSYHVYVNGTKVCSILYNQNSCTGTVNGSGSAPGLARSLVEVYWSEGNQAGNAQNVINKQSFWTTFSAAPNSVNVPTSAVTFTLSGGNPNPNYWNFYLRSSDEVSANGPMTMPTSKNDEISHQVVYTKYNRYSVVQPILAGCYTVAVLDKDSSGTTEATLGSTTADKVLCVGNNTPATVDFNFTTKQISINP